MSLSRWQVFTVATICANWRSVQIGSRRDALRWGCTVPLLFSAMLVSSMFAMEHNTLGTVVVFRNVAPLFTLLIERLFRVPMQVRDPEPDPEPDPDPDPDLTPNLATDPGSGPGVWP